MSNFEFKIKPTFSALAEFLWIKNPQGWHGPDHKREIGYKTTAEFGVYNRTTVVVIRHHGNPIAMLAHRFMQIDNAGWDSKTTCVRLNKILRANVSHNYFTRIKNGEMRFVYPGIDAAGLENTMEISMSEVSPYFSKALPNYPFMLHEFNSRVRPHVYDYRK